MSGRERDRRERERSAREREREKRQRETERSARERDRETQRRRSCKRMSPQLNLLRSTSSSRLGAKSTEYSVLLQAADRTQAKPCRSCRRRRRRGRREAER